MDVAIRCRNLRKTYAGKPPVEAVRGLDLEVRAGECFGLLGPNGAGKTTTVEILEGILDATGGDVEVLGLRWGSDDAALRERIGVSLQETRLADKLTVEETLDLFSSFYRNGRPAAKIMDEVGLTEKRRSFVVKLSGGQKQRLAVACALAGDPDLLFMDEPTTGLDPQSRRQVWEIVRDLRRRGRTILLTTHYMDEAEKLCDRVAVVDHGRVIALGTPAELIAGLRGEHVVEFALDGNGTADAAAMGGAVAPGGAAGGEHPAATGAPLPTLDPQSLLTLPSVTAARAEASGFLMTVGEAHLAIPALLERLGREGHVLSRLTTRHASLEDVFVSLTGRHLREE